MKIKIGPKSKAISAILIMFCMLVTLLPTTVSAAENRKVISIVRGSASTATYPPAFGKKAVEPYIMVFQGAPAYFNTSGGNWYRKNADTTETKLEKSDTFTEGTYYFRCKVQISAPDGIECVLNKDGITADVNGVNWETDGDVSITDKSSYVWVKSPERVVKSPYKNIGMSFEPNGGEGTQAPVFTDQYGDIYFPECTFTKEGDEFFAWNVSDVLHFPDESYSITKDTTATAVWKSELTKNIAVTMNPISEGKTPAEIAFGYDTQKYSVSAVWCEGDSFNNLKIVDSSTPLSVSKNYTVRLTINSTEFLAPIDELNITLNGKKMEKILQRESKKVILDVQILNDVSVDFWEPMDWIPLATSSEMTPSSDRFSVSSASWYGSLNANPGDRYTDGSPAIPGKKYYLSLTLQSAAENLILGGDTVKVNGKSYRTEDRDIASYKDSVILILEFTTTYPKVKVSEKGDSTIQINSPTNMSVTVAMALYTVNGRLIEIITKPNVELTKGENTKAFTDFIDTEDKQELKKVARFVIRSNTEKVKVMVFKDSDSLLPMCPSYNYKYRKL